MLTCSSFSLRKSPKLCPTVDAEICSLLTNMQGFRVIKQPQRMALEISHQKCFEMVRKFEEEFNSTTARGEEQKAKDEELVQQLRAEFREEQLKMQQISKENEKLLADKHRLETELEEVKGLLESARLAIKNKVPWAAAQPAMIRAHHELLVAQSNFLGVIQNILSGQDLGIGIPVDGYPIARA